MTKRSLRHTAGPVLGDLTPGDQIGDYVIDAKLQAVGTGIVYAGHHVAVAERQVVIRVMPMGESLDEVAHALDELDHPGTPRIFGHGIIDGRRWIAVERIAGSTLAEVLAHRTLAAMEVLALLRDVATLLSRAHAEGIVHGNITPENIVVPDDKRSAICLTGWEGARLVTSTLPAPFVVGTAFTAPEQMRGDILDDARTDMYAVGVIAFVALHGTLPGERHVQKSPTLLETLIDQMLCNRPDLRPTSGRVRAAVSWLCTAGSIGKKESWIVPTVAIDSTPSKPCAWEAESWIEQTVMDCDPDEEPTALLPPILED